MSAKLHGRRNYQQMLVEQKRARDQAKVDREVAAMASRRQAEQAQIDQALRLQHQRIQDAVGLARALKREGIDPERVAVESEIVAVDGAWRVETRLDLLDTGRLVPLAEMRAMGAGAKWAIEQGVDAGGRAVELKSKPAMDAELAQGAPA